jgi:hypothetical protein
MPFWKKSSSPPHDPAMKSIVYRGGVVTFRIPSRWREEYSDFEGGTFYEDRPDSGILRLKIISLVSPKQLHPNSGMEVLQAAVDLVKNGGREGTTRVRKDGNALLKYEETGFERGTFLNIFYWVVANPLPARRARVATFSYTTLAKLRNDPQIWRDLEMLDAEIEAAVFWPMAGV